MQQHHNAPTLVFECGTYGFVELSKKARSLEQYMGHGSGGNGGSSGAGGGGGGGGGGSKETKTELLTNTDFQPRGKWILCRSPGDFDWDYFQDVMQMIWPTASEQQEDDAKRKKDKQMAGNHREAEKRMCEDHGSNDVVHAPIVAGSSSQTSVVGSVGVGASVSVVTADSDGEEEERDEENEKDSSRAPGISELEVAADSEKMNLRTQRTSEWLDHIRNASKALFLLTLPELSVSLINQIQAYCPPIAESTTTRMRATLAPLPVQADEPDQSYKRRQAQFPITCGTLHALRTAMVGEYSKEEVDADIAILKHSMGKEESINKQNVIFCAALNRWYHRLNLSAFETYGSIPSIHALVQFLEGAQQALQANGRKTFMSENTFQQWSNHFIAGARGGKKSSHTRGTSPAFDNFGGDDNDEEDDHDDGDDDANDESDEDIEEDDDGDLQDPFKSKRRMKQQRRRGSTSGATMLLLSVAAILAVGGILGGAFMLGLRRSQGS